MANKRDLVLDQYGISKHRYRELANFCLQYKEFKTEKSSCYTLSSSPMNGLPHGNTVNNPTANNAERAYKLSKNIELIEQTAIEASGQLYFWLIKAVSEGLSWKDLCPPCGENQFREDRRRFFYILNLKK